MPDIKNYYGTATDNTITLASLASDTTLVAGRQGTEVDNTVVRALDYLVSGKITTGTTPTVGSIELWAVASYDILGTTYPDVITNAGDAAKTWTTAAIKSGAARLLWSQTVTTTSNIAYPFSGLSVAGVFNGTCPARWVPFVVHGTVAALNATAANHLIRVLPVYGNVS